MNTSSVLLGALMLAAAAAGIYFDDVAIRIVAGGIFVVSAVLLYYSLARVREENPDESGEDQERVDALADGEHNAPAPRREMAMGATAQENDEQFRARPQAPRPARRASGNGEIPEDYYIPQKEVLPPDDPRAEFDFLTGKLLSVLKDHLIAHTVGLFWINHDRKQIVIGEYVTDSRNFTTARRLALGNDLVSNVGMTGRPVLLSELSAASEGDLLVYYDAREGIQSFVGVPLYFMEEPIAVVAADSLAPDAFGKETVAAIGKFTILISTLLASYNQKFDLAADSKLMGVLDRMKRNIHSHMDSYGIASAAATAVTEILDWDHLAVILQNPDKQSWIVVKSQSKTSNLPYVSEGVTVGMDGSVFQEVTEHLQGRIIPAPKPPKYRFHEKEMLGTDGQICAVPLARSKRNPGLIVVEYRESAQYGQRDLDVLTHIADVAGTYIEVVRLQDLTRKYLMIDEAGGVASRAYFLQRLTDETLRIKAFGGEAVFLIAGIDTPDELQNRHGQAGLQLIESHAARILREGVLPFDVVGKYDQHHFGMLLLHCTAEEAYLRCEKLRKAIASHIVYHEGVSFSASASLAGCTISPGYTVEQIARVAQQAMERAISDGGNCVKVV